MIDSKNYIESCLPPHSNEAEQSVLGSLLLQKDGFLKVNDIISGECFYNLANKLIFETLKAMFTENISIDMVTICERLNKDGNLEKIGGVVYISDLITKTPTSENIETYSRIVVEYYLKRQIIAVGNELTQKGYNITIDALDLLQTSLSTLTELTQNLTHSKTDTPTEWTVKTWEHIESIQEGKTNLLQTGYYMLDKMLQGGFGVNFHIIAGLPSQGKTSFAVQMVQNNRKKPMLFHSMDDNMIKLGSRLLSNDTGLNGRTLKQLEYPLTNSERTQIMKSLNDFSSDNSIFINDRFMDIDDFFLYCQSMKKRYNIQYVICDYIQQYRCRAVRSSDEVKRITYISGRLKELSRLIDCQVIALSQLNREVYNNKGKMPYLNNLRQSGSLEQDADVVIFMYNPFKFGFEQFPAESNFKGESTKSKAEIIVAKNKDGETGSILLEYKPDLYKYIDTEISKGYQEPPESEPIKHFQDTEKGYLDEDKEDVPF